MVAQKLQVYPRDQQKVLMVIACLGSHSTQSMIETALQEDAADSLEQLVMKGKLVFDAKDSTYTIGINAVKTAAYDMIGEELQPAFHLEIGLRLMEHLDPEELEEKLFCVAMQLDKGISLIPRQELKYKVAALFVRVAEKTAETFSFNATLRALRIAYNLLGPKHWEEAYDLSIAIYNYLAEIEFALDDSERVDKLLDEIDEKGRNCSDKLQAYTTRVHVLGVRGQPDAAIDNGICILRSLGVYLHTDYRRLNLMWSFAKVSRKVRTRSNEMLRRLPDMSDPKQLTAMQVLNLLFLNTFLHRRELFPFVVLKMMKMSLQHGLSAMSSVAFAGYGTLLTFCGHGEEAQRFGKLSLALVDRFEANSFRSRVYGLVYGLIQPAVQPWKDSLDKLNEGHELGMMTGDVEFGRFCAHLHVGFMMDDASFKVEEILAAIEKYADLTKAEGKAQHVDFLAMKPLALAFQAYSDPNADLTKDFDFLKEACEAAVANGRGMTICMVYYTRIYVLFSIRQYQEALKVLDEKHALQPPMGTSMLDSFEMLMEGLVVFACARQETNKSARKCLIQRGQKAMKTLHKLSVQNPDNCLAKFTLLEAEYAALCKKDSVAKLKYSQAMAVAAGNRNYFETIFSKQAAGMHYVLDLQNPRSGLKYLEESIDVLKEFGGHAAATFWEAIVRDLKDKRSFGAFLG
jgi:predicted ATPase